MAEQISGQFLREVACFDVSCPDLLRSFEGARREGYAFYRREPVTEGGEEILGIGVALNLGGDDFTAAVGRLEGATARLDENAKKALRILGWTAFDSSYPRPSWTAFPRRTFFVPQIVIRRTHDRATVVVAAVGQSWQRVWERWRSSIVAPHCPEATPLRREALQTEWLDGKRF
ncbi:MAG: hypothetical protein ACNA8W_24900, partial [Bradymonadaceae bacterium]